MTRALGQGTNCEPQFLGHSDCHWRQAHTFPLCGRLRLLRPSEVAEGARAKGVAQVKLTEEAAWASRPQQSGASGQGGERSLQATILAPSSTSSRTVGSASINRVASVIAGGSSPLLSGQLRSALRSTISPRRLRRAASWRRVSFFWGGTRVARQRRAKLQDAISRNGEPHSLGSSGCEKDEAPGTLPHQVR